LRPRKKRGETNRQDKMDNLKKKITAIKAGKNPRVQRSNIYLDEKFAFSLDNEVILKEKLKVGQPITPQQLEKLNGSDNYQRCLNAAFQFLSVRPRSQSETTQRLTKRGFAQPEIEKTVEKLKNLKLLNDSAFAEYWKENRTAFRPRSQRVLKLELRRKGVAAEVVNAAVSQVDETANAYQAATTKSRTLPTTDYQSFHKRLSGFLLRRGFGYGVIKNTVKLVWQEKTGVPATQFDLEEETGTSQD
jgi:regulatory protein